MSNGFGVVILAAGGSSRLGQPKQLLPYGGTTLVGHAAITALASCAAQVVVVVGANASAVIEALNSLPVTIVSNPDWAAGMGSSIGCGVAALDPDIGCTIVSLCDQPHVTSEHLLGLVMRHFETGAPIVASSYDGVIGAPSAFAASLFPSLKSLTGDSGARDLIRNSPTPIETVEFGGGSFDIDTPADYDRLKPDA